MQSGAIAQSLFCGGIGLVVAALSVLEQQIGGSDNVFNLGTVLGFQQRDSVDQHRLVGNKFGCLLELGQGSARSDAPLEYGLGLQVDHGGEQRQFIVGAIGSPNGLGTCHVIQS